MLQRYATVFTLCSGLLVVAMYGCRTTKFADGGALRRGAMVTPQPTADARPSPGPEFSPVPSGSPDPQVDQEDQIDRIEVTPASRLVAIGETGTYQARAIYRIAGPRDVTAAAVWSIQNNAIAISKGGGIVQARAAGVTQVVATLEGKSASAQLSVPAGSPQLKVGVNFEDRPFTGDKDFNDAVLCFTGRVAVAPNVVTSLADQTIRGVVTRISKCDHHMVIRLTGPGAYSWTSNEFRTSSQPRFDIPFKAGSVLDVTFKPVAGCGDNNRVWVGMYNPQWSRLLPGQCNTTGR